MGYDEQVPDDSMERAYWYLQAHLDHLPHPPGAGCSECWERLADIEEAWADTFPREMADAPERDARSLIAAWYLAASTVIEVRTPLDFDPRRVPGLPSAPSASVADSTTPTPGSPGSRTPRARPVLRVVPALTPPTASSKRSTSSGPSKTRSTRPGTGTDFTGA